MEHAAVELDHEPTVLIVAVAHADRGTRTLLPSGPGQPMCPLDAIKISMLKDRAGALGYVDKDRPQPAATANPLAGVENPLQASRCRAARPAGVGQHRDGLEIRPCTARNVKRRIFVTHSRRSDVPEHPLLEMCEVVNAHTVWLGQHGALSRDGDMDQRAFVR